MTTLADSNQQTAALAAGMGAEPNNNRSTSVTSGSLGVRLAGRSAAGINTST